MGEAPVPKIDIQKQMPPREVRYPGNRRSLMEVTTSDSHVERINILNNALDPDEYAEAGPETLDDTVSWLRGGSTRKFSHIRPESSKRALVGVGQTESTPTSEMVIGVANPSNELGGYVYVYNHQSPSADRLPAPEGVVKKEISFVTDLPDHQRNTDEMAEAMQQTAMMLWEIQAGKTVDQLTGSFTAEQLKEAQQLQIFATAGVADNEIYYVEGLHKAGFVQIGIYEEDGEAQQVLALDIDRLLKIMQVKKDTVSH